MEQASIGRSVHYVLEVVGVLVHRPARITSIDPGQPVDVQPKLNLHVDVEPGDVPMEGRGLLVTHIARVPYDPAKAPRAGTWHWPERT